VLTSKESLWKLLSKCMRPGCVEQCQIEASTKGGISCLSPCLSPGAQVNAKMTCVAGHEEFWSSCNNVKEKRSSAAEVNIDISSSMLLSGLRYARLKVSSHSFQFSHFLGGRSSATYWGSSFAAKPHITR
jgi:hypothetical protein